MRFFLGVQGRPTEILASDCYHLAIDLVDDIVNLLQGITVGDDLVPSDDVLQGISLRRSLPRHPPEPRRTA